MYMTPWIPCLKSVQGDQGGRLNRGHSPIRRTKEGRLNKNEVATWYRKPT